MARTRAFIYVHRWHLLLLILVLGGGLIGTAVIVQGTAEETSLAPELQRAIEQVQDKRLKEHDYSGTRDLANQLLQANAGNPLVVQALKYEIAAAYYAEANKDSALAVIEALVADPGIATLDPAGPLFRVDDALFLAGRIHEQKSGDATATDQYRRIWTDYPTSDQAKDALLRGAGGLERLKRDAESILAYTQLITQHPNTPASAEGRFYLAGIYRRQQKLPEAAVLLEEASQFDFQLKVDAIWYAGKTYAEMGNVVKALERFESIIAAHKDYRHLVEVQVDAATLYTQGGQTAKALGLYKTMVDESIGTSRGPATVQRVNRALMQMDGDRWNPKQASRQVDFERMADIESNLARLLERHSAEPACSGAILDVVNYIVHPAWISAGKGSEIRSKVIALTGRLIDGYPNSPEIWAARTENAQALAATNPQEALARMQQLVADAEKAGDPKQLAGIVFNQGALFLDTKQPTAARLCFERSLQADLDMLFKSEIQLCLAYALEREGQIEEALRTFDAVTANAACPVEVRAHAMLDKAWCLRHAKQLDQARATLSDLIQRFPNEPAAARAAELQGRF